jgi:DNA topoisomerase-1
LVIPPAWTDVWICPSAQGHLQAVGRDAKGRKQYRYHPLYRQIRDLTKFERLSSFSRILPAVRRRVQRDLRLPGSPKEKVIAAIVRLLETSCIRIGNEDYVTENHSYGLTTLRNKHIRVHGGVIRFHFKGKSGQVHDIEVNDLQLAKILRNCQSIPGQELFQYVNEAGERSKITSEDVNGYLRETTGEYFTAKDFRTWMGTVEAFRLLSHADSAPSRTAIQRTYARVVKLVSEKLGNRPATTKKYYIHPAILDAYTEGGLHPRDGGLGNTPRSMRALELQVAALLSRHQRRRDRKVA